MRIIKHILLSATTAMLALTSCHKEHNELAHDHAHEHDKDAEAESSHSGEIILDDHQAQTLGVTVTKVEPGDFVSVLEVSGSIAPMPSDESAVTARTAGIVHFAPGISQGATVGAGQRIATISARGMAQGYATEGTRVAVEAAKRELDRITPLAEDGIVTRREYNAARARYDEARAAASATNAQAASGATAATAGTITSVLVSEGAYVEAGQPLAYISANSSLSLRADVPDRFAGFIASVTDASFRTAYSDATLEISDFGASLTGKPTTAAASGGYIPVYFRLRNDGSLISGTYCTVYLRGARRQDVITVPQDAITEQQGQKFVYLREHPGAYRKQPVTTGDSDGINVEITAGLKPGQEVVTQGATFVRLAETSSVVPEGHKH